MLMSGIRIALVISTTGGAVLGVGRAIGRIPVEPQPVVVRVVVEFLIFAVICILPHPGAVGVKIKRLVGILHTLPCAGEIPHIGVVVVIVVVAGGETGAENYR